jgi:hypothetical protein
LRRIVEHTGETMQFLNDHQIELNMEIVFKSPLPEQNTILIALNGTNLEIPVSVAEKLFVEKL